MGWDFCVVHVVGLCVGCGIVDEWDDVICAVHEDAYVDFYFLCIEYFLVG